MLKEFVKEEVKNSDHDEILTTIISYLIEVKNDGKNNLNDNEIKNIHKEKSQSLSRLESKKIECILDLVKKEYLN